MKKLGRAMFLIILILILTCIFAACGDNQAQKPSNGNGSNENNNIATPYIRFVVDDVEYSKVQTKGNEIIVMPANPTKDGYTFVGWFWDKGTWKRPFTANSMLNEPLKSDMAVYAYFERLHEHTYSKDWTYDATNHWHASTCGHSVVDGKDAHVFNNVHICKVCGYVDVSLHGTEIKTNTLNLENNKISGNVPNNQEVFSFIDEIIVTDGAKFTVSTDINGSNVIRTKTVNLAIGDNTYYILVENGKDIKLYNVSIRRRPIYTVTFNANGGTDVQAQQVEEDSLATEPTTERLGYDFVEWSYDFSKPIVKDEIVVATWNIVTYKITYDLNGGENPSTNPSIYTVEDDIILSAPIKTGYTGTWSNSGLIAKGSTGDKHFVATYVVNQYSVTIPPSNCAISGSGVYDYASSITLEATLYLGYDFVGWYDGNTLLSEENTYVFTMPASNLTIIAKTTVKEDMQNFEFSSTLDSCIITGLINKSITELSVPDYVTNIMPEILEKTEWYNAQPDGLVYVGKIAYKYKGDIPNDTAIVLKEGTIGISDCAFINCTGLASIVIPDSVISIGGAIFAYCPSLESIVVKSGNTKYGSTNNCLISFEEKSVIAGCKTSLIPDDGSIICIGIGAFAGCNRIENIALPSSIKSIDECAFQGCTELNDIIIPNGVISIGEYAFAECTKLKSIEIPESVTSIGDAAFVFCSMLTTVSIPSSVTNIGGSLFAGCKKLSEVIIPKGVTNIGMGAFADCGELKNVVIPNGVTSIGEFAFCDCSSLERIEIPESVIMIGEYAFSDCVGLVSFIYGGTMEQWNAIEKGQYWINNEGNTYDVICKDGTLTIR